MSAMHAPDAKAQRKADKAYAKATRPWYKKKRFWLLGLLLLVVIAVALSGGGDDASSSKSGTAPAVTDSSAQPDAAAEAPVTVSADKLTADLKDNALKASSTYKGKRVTTTGVVSNIDASGAYFSIRGSDEFDLSGIQVFIDDEQKNTVAELSTGQKVTVTGEVTDVGEVMGYSIQAESIK
ncbi:OB-fold protein [Gephyromycinifex aptenodytis]|uniref:OB-fold protein n=1 Tax=Gephyromycinifex aptenodytis TaxID=2716227 RepID=UPI001B2FEF1E|nr:hypothetical protein [Gephyromycinifex aptenodytis]